MDNAVALASIALVGTILAVVVKPLFALLKANTAATTSLSKSMEKVAESNKEIAKETRQGNKEAKQRNGHLAELVNEGNAHMTDVLKSINDTSVMNNNSTLEILSTIKASASTLEKNTAVALEGTKEVASALFVAADKLQTPAHIENQTVDHQIVNNSETKEQT